MNVEQYRQATGSFGWYLKGASTGVVFRRASPRGPATSGFPNVPPIVVSRGSSEIDPMRITAMAGGRK